MLGDFLGAAGNLFIAEIIGITVTVFLVDSLYAYRSRSRDLDVSRRVLAQFEREVCLQHRLLTGSAENGRIERIATIEQADSWKRIISLLRKRYPMTTSLMTNPLLTGRSELLDDLWSSVETLNIEIAKAEMLAWYQSRELDEFRTRSRRWMPEFDSAPAGDMSFAEYDKPFDEIPMSDAFDRLDAQFVHLREVIREAQAEDVTFFRLIRDENILAKVLLPGRQ